MKHLNKLILECWEKLPMIYFICCVNAVLGQSPAEGYIEITELKKHFLDTIINKDLSKNWKLRTKSDSMIVVQGTRNSGLNNSLVFFVKSKDNGVNFIISGNKFNVHSSDSSLMIDAIFEIHGDLIVEYNYCAIQGSLPELNSFLNYSETINWLEENSICNFNSHIFVDADKTITVLYLLDGMYNFQFSINKKRLKADYYKKLKKLNKMLD